MASGANDGFRTTELTTSVVMAWYAAGVDLRVGDSVGAAFTAVKRSDELVSTLDRDLILRFARIDQLVTATGRIHAGKGVGTGFPLEASLVVTAVDRMTDANWIQPDHLLWREMTTPAT